MDDVSDEDDEDDLIKKPPTAKPQAVPPKMTPPAPIRDSVASSRASENVRATDVVVPTHPAPTKPIEEAENPRKSIKELAALIRPGTLGGMSGPPTRQSVPAVERDE